MKKIDFTRKDWLSKKNKRQTKKIVLQNKLKQYYLKKKLAREFILGKKFGPTSKIIELLAHEDSKPAQVAPKHINVTIPSSFSFIEQPERTLRLLRDLSRLVRGTRHVKSIHIDHSRMDEFDLAANALLDTIIIETQQQYRLTRRNIQKSGEYPSSADAKRFIRSIGIVKHLNVESELFQPAAAKRFKIFDTRVKHYSKEPANLRARRETVALQFAKHFNDCLAINERKLTEGGEKRLIKCLTEMINNAEEHAGMLDWSVLGYMDTGLEVPMCEIAIFNFGKAISKTFQELDRASLAWKPIKNYVEHHSRSNIFDSGWREQDLLTIVALQPRISSKTSADDTTRGVGTVDLLKFFLKIHRDCNGEQDGAKMVIVSGSTCIRFDGKYNLDPQQGKTVVAFNDANDLHERPNSDYVKTLGDLHFPGTIISIKFPISAIGARGPEND